MAKTRTIDGYLATVTGDQRALLADLRAKIRAIVPDAEECIRYDIPAFRLGGAIVAGFAARKGGGSYYPFSGRTLATLAGDLTAYTRTKGALHFDRPLPKTLVRKLIRTRLAE
jgi:uncharacterized protein YdhG (YjbR/CyaY superfamily)